MLVTSLFMYLVACMLDYTNNSVKLNRALMKGYLQVVQVSSPNKSDCRQKTSIATNKTLVQSNIIK